MRGLYLLALLPLAIMPPVAQAVVIQVDFYASIIDGAAYPGSGDGFAIEALSGLIEWDTATSPSSSTGTTNTYALTSLSFNYDLSNGERYTVGFENPLVQISNDVNVGSNSLDQIGFILGDTDATLFLPDGTSYVEAISYFYLYFTDPTATALSHLGLPSMIDESQFAGDPFSFGGSTTSYPSDRMAFLGEWLGPELGLVQIDAQDIDLQVRATPVPEPSTIMLLGAGLAGLPRYARKKR